MEIAIVNTSGKKTTKKVKLNKDIFGIEPNDHAIYLDVKQYLANQRTGTHKAKERADIKGSTRKIKKQKGTGTARAGSIKNPLFKGGGRVFGPRPRSYDFKLNKKVKKLARKSALTYKAKEDSILVIEDIKMDQPRTKDFVSILNGLNVADKKTLIVVSDSDSNINLSSRNLTNVKVIPASQLNTYDILNAKSVVLAEGSIDKIEKQLLN